MAVSATYTATRTTVHGTFAIQPGACDPHLTIHDTTVAESDSGETTAHVTVTLSKASTSTVKLYFEVNAMSALEMLQHRASAEGEDADFAPIFAGSSTYITFAPGQTQRTIQVTIFGDTDVENNEVFQVRAVGEPLNARLADGTAVVTIVNDDIPTPGRPIDAILFYDFQTDANAFETVPNPDPLNATATPIVHSSGMTSAEGLLDEGGVGRSAKTVGAEPGDYFSFTVSAPLRVDQLEFWDKRVLPGAAPQSWEVRWSVDDFAAPLPLQELFTVSEQFFGDAGIPVLPELLPLLGWRRMIAALPLSHPWLGPTNLCILEDVEFRIIGLDAGQTLVDNVALRNNLVNRSCDPSVDRFAGETLEWLDQMAGRVTIDVIGGGFAEATLFPPQDGGDIDPQRLDLLELINVNPAATQVLVTVENPGAIPAGAFLSLGVIQSEAGVFRIDLTGVPMALVTLNIGGPVAEFLAGGLADGSQLIFGGDADDELAIDIDGTVGGIGGRGVDVSFPGIADVRAESWLNGLWDIGGATKIETTNGGFSPSIIAQTGIDQILVRGGDFASPSVLTGVSPATRDGSIGEVVAIPDASGIGGTVSVPRFSIDGDLGLLEARGGAIAANLRAGRVGAVRATTPATKNSAGVVEGFFNVESMNLLATVGSEVTASLTTTDAAHQDLIVDVRPDELGRGGSIESRHSFHIAGGVESIVAHQIDLRLISGGVVELIEAVAGVDSAPGKLHGEWTAQRFEMIRAVGNDFEFEIYPLNASSAPSSGARLEPSPPGCSGEECLYLELLKPAAPVALAFAGQASEQNPLVLATSSFVAVVIGETSLDAGPVSGPAGWNGQPLNYDVSDDRFEIRDGRLVLKEGITLLPRESASILVFVTASSPEGFLQLTHDFTIAFDAVFALEGDADGDGRVDLNDLNAVRNHFGQGMLGGPRIPGDAFPFDGIVDLNDLNRVRNRFGDAFDLESLPGDTNDDERVDLEDLNNVRNTFGASGAGATGDANGDGVVNLEDLNAVRNNFGVTESSGSTLDSREQVLGDVASRHLQMTSPRNQAIDMLFGQFNHAESPSPFGKQSPIRLHELTRFGRAKRL
jgi:hypothetical protein